MSDIDEQTLSYPVRETFEQYVSDDAVNWSSLKHVDTSLLTYKYNKENDRPDTAALKAGRYAHAAIFEPESLGETFAVYQGEGNRNTNDYKAFAAKHSGKVVFYPKEIAALDRMVAAVRAHPLVAPYLACKDGQFETSIRWVDERTGLRCKGRLDWIIPSLRTVIDFKTMRSTEIRSAVSAIKRYGYDGQSAHYSNGVRAALGWEVEHYIMIGAEKTGPYEVLVMPFGEEIRTMASERVQAMMDKLKVAMDSNEWPGRYTEPMPLARETSGVPTWIFGGDDDSTIIYEEE